jgi:predicted RNA-binding Zn-ribbon protein involved in translation (DUF1610 family)
LRSYAKRRRSSDPPVCLSISRTIYKAKGLSPGNIDSDKIVKMSFPIKTCVVCGEEFELKPGKPGFANRCPECSVAETEAESDNGKRHLSAEERKAEAEANAERRKAIRDLLYKKDR